MQDHLDKETEKRRRFWTTWDAFRLLSPKEYEVMAALRKGYTYAEVAEELSISEDNVRATLSRINKKHLRQRAEQKKDTNRVLREFVVPKRIKKGRNNAMIKNGKFRFSIKEMMFLYLFMIPDFDPYYHLVEKRKEDGLEPYPPGALRVFLHGLRKKVEEYNEERLKEIIKEYEQSGEFHEAESPEDAIIQEAFFYGSDRPSFGEPQRMRFSGTLSVADRKERFTDKTYCERCPVEDCPGYCTTCVEHKCESCTVCTNREWKEMRNQEVKRAQQRFLDKVNFENATPEERRLMKMADEFLKEHDKKVS